jgi:hypothetical protein
VPRARKTGFRRGGRLAGDVILSMIRLDHDALLMAPAVLEERIARHRGSSILAVAATLPPDEHGCSAARAASPSSTG